MLKEIIADNHRNPFIVLCTHMCAVLIVGTALFSASANRARAGNDAQNLAIGIGIVGGLLLLNEAAKAEEAKKHSSKSRATAAPQDGASVIPKKFKRKYAVTPRPATTAPVTAQPVPAAAPALATVPQTPTPAAVKTAVATISTPEEIKFAQQHLKFLGYDLPEPNGILDAKTKGAIMLYQESIKAPTTGELTLDQLPMLAQKVASQNEPAQ